jgi:Fe-S cluster biogenesis protein NfuA
MRYKMELNLNNLETVIREEVNPSLAVHRGFVQVAALEEKRVILSFHAGCAGCPASQGATLDSIQRYLSEHFEIADLVVENAETAE